jgi:hypothetical protein
MLKGSLLIPYASLLLVTLQCNHNGDVEMSMDLPIGDVLDTGYSLGRHRELAGYYTG